MSKAKFEAARELINERRFDEARTILKTIDHPKAKEWLDKLDKLQPPKAKKRGSVSVISLFIVLLVLVAVMIGKVVSDQRQISLEASATQDNRISLAVSPSPSSTGISTETPQPTATNIPLPTAAPQSTATPDIASRIVGTWVETGGFISYTFYSDGTGVIFGMETTYQIVGDKLTTHESMNGDPNAITQVETIVSLTHDTLRLDTGTLIQILHRQ